MIFVVVVVVVKKKRRRKIRNMDIKTSYQSQGLCRSVAQTSHPGKRRPSKDAMASIIDGKKLFETQIVFYEPIVENSGAINIAFESKFNRLEHDDPKVRSAVQGEWKKRKALNPKLFNGSKFRFHSVTKSVKKFGDKEDGVATVNLGLTSYGDFLGTNYNSAISKRLLADGVAKHGNPQSYMADPLGVGALVLTEDNYFVAFQRSDVVGEFSGFVDLPGGHPEPSEVGIAIDFFNAPVTRFNGSSHVEQSPEYTIVSDKGIQGNCIKRTDYVVCGDEGDISPKPNVQIVSMKSILKELFNSILMEVHLEINIPLANLSPPKLIGILRQLGQPNGRASMSFVINCNLKSNQVKEMFALGPKEEDESSGQLLLLHRNDVLSGAVHTKHKFTPATTGSFEIYRKVVGKSNAVALGE